MSFRIRIIYFISFRNVIRVDKTFPYTPHFMISKEKETNLKFKFNQKEIQIQTQQKFYKTNIRRENIFIPLEYFFYKDATYFNYRRNSTKPNSLFVSLNIYSIKFLYRIKILYRILI